MAETRFRSSRNIQIRPPHLAARNYHLLELTLRAWAALNAGSRPLDSSAKTSFSLDVTSSSRCFAKYSETAVAYNALLDTPCRSANSLADRNSSSGSEIAVFILQLYQRAPLSGQYHHRALGRGDGGCTGVFRARERHFRSSAESSMTEAKCCVSGTSAATAQRLG